MEDNFLCNNNAVFAEPYCIIQGKDCNAQLGASGIGFYKLDYWFDHFPSNWNPLFQSPFPGSVAFPFVEMHFFSCHRKKTGA